MEMQMQMKSYLKDSKVGSGVRVVTPTDSNVGVGVGVVTPNGTANHELAAQPLIKLRIAALFFKAAHQFMEAKDSGEMNEINTTEEAIPTRYYCCSCCHLVTVDVEVEIKCPFCHDGIIQARRGVNSLYLTMSSESEHSESGSNGEGLVDEQRHVIRVLVLSFCQLVFIHGIGRFSVFTSGLGHSMTEMRWGGLSIEHPSSCRDYIYRSRITIGKGKQFYTFSVLLRCWLFKISTAFSGCLYCHRGC